jgi:hypothetical protein
MMAKVTKTINPLHFEDLEPHRFEDLVRQLIYDFRQWRSLEATGRAGSDEGMDIRAIEKADSQEVVDGSEEMDEESTAIKENVVKERLWIIQCKRETTIGPQKVRDIVSDNISQQKEIPYGYILASSCDFSKKARDAFKEECLKIGLGEYYIWGKSEVEDQLFLPKNDHILFAYFGISLQLRRRSIRTELRSKLALKRKLVKELGEINRPSGYKAILIRDPRDENYPYIISPEEFIKSPRWRYWQFYAHEPPDYLAFVYKRHYAYVNWETKEYDILEGLDDGVVHPEIFGLDREWYDPKNLSYKYRMYWYEKVPKENQAWDIELRAIPYERILAFDEIGDSYNNESHLLVEYLEDNQPFEHQRSISFFKSEDRFNNKGLLKKDGKRISYFPPEIPEHIIKDEPESDINKT